MSERARPLFVDTGAFYARADEDDQHHEQARAAFDAIRRGDLPFRPLYTSQAVLSELASLVLYRAGHGEAARLLTEIRDSRSVNVLVVDRPTFTSARDQFVEYDDQDISFVDHTSAVLATERDVDHVFAFDDDFRTLGFSRVPVDTGEVA